MAPHGSVVGVDRARAPSTSTRRATPPGLPRGDTAPLEPTARPRRVRPLRRPRRRHPLVARALPRARPRSRAAAPSRPGRASGVLPRGGQRPDHHAPPPLPHQGGGAPRAHPLGPRHRLGAPPPRPHLRPRPPRRRGRVPRARTRRRARRVVPRARRARGTGGAAGSRRSTALRLGRTPPVEQGPAAPGVVHVRRRPPGVRRPVRRLRARRVAAPLHGVRRQPGADPREDGLVGRAMSAEGTRRAIIAAFLANLGIAISKFFAFAITGSASMLAESIHSIADTGNQGLLFLGGKRSRKAPTDEHPFGFGTERYFWAFIVALVLFTLGSLFALVRGRARSCIDPHELDSPIVAYTVLGIAIVVEGLSLRTAHHEALPSRQGRTWWKFIRTTKSPELPVVLLEDSGALVGLLFALVGISLAEITGNARWDALGQRRHRPAARGDRGDPRHRDEEPAHRRGGVARGRRAASAPRSSTAPRSRASSTCARCTWAPTTCSSPPSSSSPATPSPRSPTRSTRSRRACDPRPRPPD